MKKSKAIFLDKDGTLVENVEFNVDPGKIKLYPDVPEALKMLKDEGFKLIVISNQPGVALGYFSEQELEGVKRTLNKMLADHDAGIDGFYYCPHHPGGKVPEYAVECKCRKPWPGMLINAARDMNIDLSRSWMVGDILHDVQAGNTAGCRTILIDNGNETEWIMNEKRKPTYTVKKLREAAAKILHCEYAA